MVKKPRKVPVHKNNKYSPTVRWFDEDCNRYMTENVTFEVIWVTSSENNETQGDFFIRFRIFFNARTRTVTKELSNPNTLLAEPQFS